MDVVNLIRAATVIQIDWTHRTKGAMPKFECDKLIGSLVLLNGILNSVVSNQSRCTWKPRCLIDDRLSDVAFYQCILSEPVHWIWRKLLTSLYRHLFPLPHTADIITDLGSGLNCDWDCLVVHLLCRRECTILWNVCYLLRPSFMYKGKTQEQSGKGAPKGGTWRGEVVARKGNRGCPGPI